MRFILIRSVTMIYSGKGKSFSPSNLLQMFKFFNASIVAATLILDVVGTQVADNASECSP